MYSTSLGFLGNVHHMIWNVTMVGKVKMWMNDTYIGRESFSEFPCFSKVP